MTRRGYSNVALPIYVIGALDDVSTTNLISVSAEPGGVAASPAGWPATKPYFAVIDAGTADEEVVLVTAVAGSTVTISRAGNLGSLGFGSSTKSHQAGAKLEHMLTAADLDEASAHINASQQVHGLASGSSVVGTTDAQTLTNKTLSSPVVTGTLTAPNLTGDWDDMPIGGGGGLVWTGPTDLGTGPIFVARYKVIGDKTVALRILLGLGTAPTIAAGVNWSLAGLPFTVSDSQGLHGFARDTSAGSRYPVEAGAAGTNVDRIYVPGGGGGVSNVAPFTWAAGDSLGLFGVVEIA